MKKNLYFLLLAVAIACTFLLMQGCSKNSNGKKTEIITVYTPVYKNKADVLASINGVSNTAITNAGKLYIKDNFIYLNEINKGIHIIDNSNPSHPAQVAFLSIPGNLDIAVKGNILYADMYDDLLALDITDVHHAKITNTLKNFFTARAYVNNYPTNTDQQVATDWIKKDTAVFINDYYTRNGCAGCEFFAPASSTTKSQGVAGSMAGMVLMNNYLYAISEMHSLSIVDVSNSSAPKLDSSFFAGFDLQTVFPFEDKLFLGSDVGVFMYDVSDPEHPSSVGEFSHGTACDPVIADGDYAYVTLHTGTDCGGDQNELDVINVKDIANSQLVKTYTLIKPTGLSKDGDLLFVCDGNNVKMYNTANPLALGLLQLISSKEPYDVIAANKKLLVVAADGLYQYDYSNTNNIRLLSFIGAKSNYKGF